MVKVIFLQNIEENKVGDVREVAEGYARNFLFRHGIAEIATEEKLKEIDSKIAKIKKEEEEKVKDAEKIAEKLKAKKIKLKVEVNEEGHLYGSVSHKEISEKLEEMGFDIDPSNIEIPEPIKEIGKHPIIIKVGHGVELDTEVEVAR